MAPYSVATMYGGMAIPPYSSAGGVIAIPPYMKNTYTGEGFRCLKPA